MGSFIDSLDPKNYGTTPAKTNKTNKEVTIKIERNAFINLMEYISEIETILAEMPNELLNKTDELSKVDIEDIKDIFDFAIVEGSFDYSNGEFKKSVDTLKETLHSMIKEATGGNDLEVEKDDILRLKGQIKRIKDLFLDILANLKTINSEDFQLSLNNQSKMLEGFLDSSDNILDEFIPESDGIEH